MTPAEYRTARALRASAKDPQAFVAVYEREVDAVLVFLTRRTCDPQAALDLVAETFAQAYRSRRRFRGATDAEAGAWLFAIARAQLAGYFRRGFAERTMVVRLGWSLPAWSEDDLDAVATFADLKSERERVAAALEALPAGTREAVRLRVIDGLGHAEVAARLGVSEEAVRARVSRGLRALAGALAVGR